MQLGVESLVVFESEPLAYIHGLLLAAHRQRILCMSAFAFADGRFIARRVVQNLNRNRLSRSGVPSQRGEGVVSTCGRSAK